ncbi:hypothetical protein NHX12_009595 [Muraenolepis orangiensis]|uniref:mitogen-activated protein kinase n=1 Tax=Muraenolepis orangiensis TaxID=630683 RepID=A0A9Q0DI35_9TELE|nr:hypothetical protein NHX12_009595 [Muraenolepis orangiensis]
MEPPVKDSPVHPGFYRSEVQKTTWDVPQRYEGLKAIGSGAYGTVCSAVDQKTKGKVAIKKLYRPFQSLLHAKRAYRELRLLRNIDHDNIPDLLHGYALRSPGSWLLRGLKYIHSAGIIHRDLKPNNLAVNENCELKILDFGLARHTESEMTGYVVTRWYRAPEIIFNWMHYSQSVDVWSAACILVEMITGKVIFPGHDSIDQLKKIMSLTGTPQSSLVQKMQSTDAQSYVKGLPVQKKKVFSEVFPDMNKKAVDLLEGMMLLDPDTRVTATQGLSHPFLSEYHDPESEPEAQAYDDSFESMELDVGEWKSLIHMEIMTFDPVNPSNTAM